MRSATKKLPLSGTLTIWLWFELALSWVVVAVCFSGMSIVEGWGRRQFAQYVRFGRAYTRLCLNEARALAGARQILHL